MKREAVAIINSSHSRPVRVVLEELALNGDLRLPEDPMGLVIFVHGSGSSRFSPRNRHVAELLSQRNLATLLVDLLTDEEQQIDSETMRYRFDIALLSERTCRIVGWAGKQPDLRRLPIGLFGASTGAAAALCTAASLPRQISAVVSRGGRPDLAQDALAGVKAPTLLIVGGQDTTVLEMNRAAIRKMTCPNDLQVIPGATHLFEERGMLEKVARCAGDWFVSHLQHAAGTRPKAVGLP